MDSYKLNIELRKFDRTFDTALEDQAIQSRGAFIRAFPIKGLRNLTLNEYVIGKGTPTFCAHVEAKTRAWANIFGATSFKFGIYFGRTESDSKRCYRFTKIGTSKSNAFRNVKAALLNLIDAGRSMRFSEIDENLLSQMFKAKILSLYFPDLYLNVCSRDNIEFLAETFGVSDETFVSEKQHLLIAAKHANPISRRWSNPKFMRFLFDEFIREETSAETPKIRKHRTIDIEAMLENRKKIGEMSEKYALNWEKERLLGLGRNDLIDQIQDRRKAPSYGYDFLSFNSSNTERYIEVKTASKDRAEGGFRFFLSTTEDKISISPECRNNYYFYLVYYDDDGNPSHVRPEKAKDFYKNCDFSPNGYVVNFD